MAMMSSASVSDFRNWITQKTTIAGIATTIGTGIGLATGGVTVPVAIPLLVGAVVGMIMPESNTSAEVQQAVTSGLLIATGHQSKPPV